MSLHRLTIEPVRKRRARGRVKTRTFEAHLLGALCADALWDLGSTRQSVHRPVWLAYFTTQGSARPFTMNLRAGRPARVSTHDRLEIPRSSTHRWVTHSVPGGVVTVSYLPELFHLDPPVPFTDDARFVFAPSRRWVDRQERELGSRFGDSAREAARAALFAAFLDRRTSLPLLRDLRFHLEIFRAAREQPWLTDDLFGPRALPCDLGHCGLDGPLVCSATADDLASFITEHTVDFQRRHPQADPLPGPRLVDSQLLLFDR
jgi:hypothetical protein